MQLVLPVYITIVSLAIGNEPAPSVNKQPTAEQIEFFEKNVRPILVNRCHQCHGQKKQEGELRLDSRAGLEKGGETGPIVKPGQPDQSELIAAINYGADSFQMPPDGKIKPAEIAALTRWVKMGAPWPKSDKPGSTVTTGDKFDLAQRAKHWSFQPVRRPGIPDVKDGEWTRNPIDRFILARLKKVGLSPARQADKRTLLRRLSYDLTGLPPTAEELQEFLGDNSPTAYEKLVERLLASPRYGERWARHWLDLVRFAETAGHEFDYEIPQAWPYRDYAIRAFNQDVPYDRFVVEHIAGDLVTKPRKRSLNGDNESVIGTAFYWFTQGKHSPVDIRAEECDTIDNQIDVLGKTFLGLTIACARCHDHKFDPIRARDYYALAGYLQSSRRQLAVLDDPQQTQMVVDLIADVTDNKRPANGRYEASNLLVQLGLLNKLMQNSPEIEEPRRKVWQKQLKEEAARNPAHLFHGWSILRDQPTPEKFAEARAALVQRLRKMWKANDSQAVNAMRFNANDFGDWYVSGTAFGQGPSHAGDLVWREQPTAGGSIVAEIVQTGQAHSGLISQRLQGTLRSPTFVVEKRYVYYRARRMGGKPNPGRALKNGQLHFIVDGFQFIKAPLYGGLTVNVPNDGRWRWHRHDVGKFLGRSAYLEIVDDDDGVIVIDQVLFSDAAPPADKPNRLLVNMLDDPALTSPQQLAKKYRQLFGNILTAWKKGQLISAINSSDQIEVISGLLQYRSLFEGVKPIGKIPAQVEASLRAYRLLSSAIRPPRRSLAMADGSSENEHLLIRGNHKKPGEGVSRQFLEVLAGENQPSPNSGSGRMQLAKLIVDPTNPFTARVMVNRLWLHHFGKGIVATPDNFGLQGKPPSHPELLDWLAQEFIDSGWSIKQMHRLMVLSNTYRMSSRSSDAQTEQRDPENILLHRMNIKRLEGEAIRDGLLAISGRLDERKYGPSVLPHLTPFMEGRGRPRRSGPLDGNGRRSIYINVRRNFLTPLFLAFDLPSPSTTVGQRSVSNVPAQALTMMNNPFVIQQAKLWADRNLDELLENGRHKPAEFSGDLTVRRVCHFYESAFSRPPTDTELTAAIGFLQEQGKEYNGPNDPRTWADLCHVLLNVKEFVFVN